MSLDRYLTAAEVGEVLGIGAGTVLDWFEAKKIRGYYLGAKGGRVRFKESDIASWVDSRANFGGGQLREVR